LTHGFGDLREQDHETAKSKDQETVFRHLPLLVERLVNLVLSLECRVQGSGATKTQPIYQEDYHAGL
jgi:hypothetical protein